MISFVLVMAKIRKLNYNGEDRWEVDFGYDADGKRLRSWFKTEKEADKAIGDREKEIKRCGECLGANPSEAASSTALVCAGRIQVRKIFTGGIRWKSQTQRSFR
jgi:hypothetical protein